MKNYNPDPVLKSADRLKEQSKNFKGSPDPVLFEIVKRESSILLRRAFKLWFQIRFGR